MKPLFRTAGAALTVLVLSLGATAGTKSNSYYKSFGNSKAGSWLSASGHVTTSVDSASAAAGVYGGIKLLGKSATAAEASADAFANWGSANAGARIRIAGMTVWSVSFSKSASASKSIQLNVFNPSPKTIIWVGPVPVIAKGNVGAGGQVSVSFTLVPSSGKAVMNGSGSGWANGWVSASLGVKGYKLTVKTTLKFGTQKLSLDVTAQVNQGPSGTMSYTITAITIYVKFEAKAWPLKYKKTLASYSYGSYTKKFF